MAAEPLINALAIVLQRPLRGVEPERQSYSGFAALLLGGCARPAIGGRTFPFRRATAETNLGSQPAAPSRQPRRTPMAGPDPRRGAFEADRGSARPQLRRADCGRARAGSPRSTYRRAVGRFPSVDAQAGYSNLATPDRSSYTNLSVSLGWELDLWGRIRNTSAAARASLLASEQARRVVLQTLVSDVASAYFLLQRPGSGTAKSPGALSSSARIRSIWFSFAWITAIPPRSISARPKCS